MMTILIGESANIKRINPRTFCVERWLSVSRRFGAFRGELAQRKLRCLCIGIGQNIAESANLCPPNQWDVGFADQTAALIRDMPFDRIFVCGRRALSCFGLDFQPRWGTCYENRYVAVPHPSGRNTWWNDEESIAACAEMLSLALDHELFERGSQCKICRHPVDDAEGDTCPACQRVAAR